MNLVTDLIPFTNHKSKQNTEGNVKMPSYKTPRRKQKTQLKIQVTLHLEIFCDLTPEVQSVKENRHNWTLLKLIIAPQMTSKIM